MAEAAPVALDACWNRIGVRGDASCPELARHVHCRNCPVHAAAAARLLDREPPPGALDHGAAGLAGRAVPAATDAVSVLVFRVAGEWLAVPSALVDEIAPVRPVHGLPHRRDPAIRGVANVRGRLVVCVALGPILGLPAAPAPAVAPAGARMVVLGRGADRFVVAVDQVHGVHRVPADRRRRPPATLARGVGGYTGAILDLEDGEVVAFLDDARLVEAVARSLS